MLRSPSAWNRELGIAVRLQTETGTRDRRPSPYGTGNSISPPFQYGDTGSQDRSRDRRPSHIKPGSRGRRPSLHREPGIRDHRPSPSRTGISRSSPVSCGTRHSRSPSVSILTRDLRIAVRLHLEPGTVRLHTTARPYGTRKSRSPSVSTWNPELRDRRPSAIWNPWVHPKSLTGCIPHRQSCMDPECLT